MRVLSLWFLCVGVVLSAAVVALSTIPVAIAGIPNSPVSVQLGIPVLRGVFYLAVVVLFSVFVRPLLRASAEGTQQMAACAALVMGAAALGQLILQTADFRPDRVLTIGAIAGYVRLMDVGRAQMGLVLLALLIAVLAVVDARRDRPMLKTTALILTCVATLVLPAVGHAVDQPDWRGRLGVVAMELHAWGAVAWIGGLLAVVSSASRTQEFPEVLSRFSTVAGYCLAIVTVTGISFGFLQLDSLPDVAWYTALFRNVYGFLLCAKLVCVLALSALGAGMRYRVLPQITAGLRSGFAYLALIELSVLGVATGIAVVLTRTSIQQ